MQLISHISQCRWRWSTKWALALAAAWWLGTGCLAGAQEPAGSGTGADASEQPVSYFAQVLPIFRTHCLGCHQPAKASGEYDMTGVESLRKGGESGEAAITPGKPDESYLLAAIKPGADGQADMPKGKPALTAQDIALIERWIASGAIDDTPSHSAPRYDQDHPPEYSRPPVLTSLDYSPDGRLLAVAGFHEVVLLDAGSGERLARLVGMSERIESVRFSPDGRKLAVTGGLPCRQGEVQIWDVAQRELLLSVPVTADTLYGGSWSPDGKLIAFGCADNTARAIDAETGEQVVQQGTHTDWVLGTAFAPDGTHVISVGRDMTAKLTEVATQRFVDNITSITPGALKGGIQAVAAHPTRAEIVVGGSDGEPKVYRIHRNTARRIGDDANLIRTLPGMQGRVFGLAVRRDGRQLAAAAALDNQGEVMLVDYPAELDSKTEERIKQIESKVERTRTPAEREELNRLRSARDLRVHRTSIPAAVYAVAYHPQGDRVAVAASDGIIRIVRSDDGQVISQVSPVPVASDAANPSLADASSVPDFIRDVNPILSRLGCNQGTCHGAAKGKNGFKLSLRGYDAIFDIRALTDDLKSRRVNVASPQESLMLMKATGFVPHVGGALITPQDAYYETIRAWIAGGAKLNLSTPRVAQIEVTPLNPIVERIGDRQSLRVMAKYADGTTRDVTREAFIESGNTEVCTVDRDAVATTLRRGEAPLLARYEGAYAATTLTVMGDRTGFEWRDPPVFNRIDELTAAKWKRLKILPSELCSDDEFLRRVSLDLTGLPPTADQVRAFLADPRDTRTKRDELVDRLVGSEDYSIYWTNKWADLLQVNRKFLGAEGAAAFRQWIRGHVDRNTPYDEFVREILTVTGSNKDHPAASYFKILRDPSNTMENTTHLFLAVRFNCNKCHDHPFERWTQDQYYETAAFFSHLELKKDPQSGDQTLGGTAVEGAKPLYEIVSDASTTEVVHERTGQPVAPKFPYELARLDTARAGSAPASDAEATRRARFAQWVTAPQNPYFAKSYVNRLWGYLFGIGLMEPIDDIRAGNPPTNPELLQYLTQEFLDSGFDVRHMARLICKSRTYQLSVAAHRWNEDDKLNYSHAIARRLPAEVLYDTVHRVTGAPSKLPGLPEGTRAAALPDSGVELPSGFFTTFGRPARESACECERSSGLQLGPVMALISGPTIAEAISAPDNDIAKLVASESDDRLLIGEIFLRVFNRPATDAEIDATLAMVPDIDADHTRLVEALRQRESEVAAIASKREQERAASIERVKNDIAAREREIAPQVAEREQQRVAAIAERERELKAYEDKIPEHLLSWEKQQRTSVEWVPLLPSSAKGPRGVTLAIGQDRSVTVTGKPAKGELTITLPTQLSNITAIRLEALTDDSLPRKGPGHNTDGNFVLTEFEIAAASTTDPARQMKLELQKPLADFSQENFSVDKAIDGNTTDANNGWAISPTGGVSHWATFEAKEPVGFEGGTTLTVTLHHRFRQPTFLLGRFRISVAVGQRDVGVSLADDLRAILANPRTQRTKQANDYLAAYFRAVDGKLREKQQAVAESKKPLPVDPQVQQLRDSLELVSRPVPPDSRLEQLRRDVELSEKQRANKRLTAAQDLVWALINSPAFLFNH